ncbi:MCE family protein [Pseudonocardia benzenivorans]
MRNGATIPISATSRAAEVEEVLGALSMLLNGGGVGQIRTITTELNKALAGNEPQIRSLLADLDTLVGTLDAHKSEITRALDSINRLSATLAARKDQIAGALQDLGPGIQELADQRAQLVDMLQALDRLSQVGTDVVDRSRDDLLADLRSLQPTLSKLAEAGQNLPNSLQMLGTFPFTDAAVPASPATTPTSTSAPTSTSRTCSTTSPAPRSPDRARRPVAQRAPGHGAAARTAARR